MGAGATLRAWNGDDFTLTLIALADSTYLLNSAKSTKRKVGWQSSEADRKPQYFVRANQVLLNLVPYVFAACSSRAPLVRLT